MMRKVLRQLTCPMEMPGSLGCPGSQGLTRFLGPRKTSVGCLDSRATTERLTVFALSHPDSAIVEITGTTTLDTGSFDEDTTIVVARRDDNWRIAAWRVMTFDETLLNMLRE